MKKSEIKKAPTNKLIVELILATSRFDLNQNNGRITKSLRMHIEDVQHELRKRDELTDEDIERLNS